MVVFKELNSGTPIPVYTSDQKKPAGDIAYYMLSRWGESENFFKEIPEKVPIIDLLQGKPMNRADLERKKLYDLIQMIAFHSRQYLIQLFRSCYKDTRDVKQVLTKITKLPGYVTLMGKTLIVLLDWIEDKKHREAAGKFCHLINSMAPTLQGRMELNLFFRVSSVPQIGALEGKRRTVYFERHSHLL